jgi:hypothetical protein
MKKTASKPLRKSANTKKDKSHKAAFDAIAKADSAIDHRPGEGWQTAFEIAEETGYSITTVRSRLKSGIKQGMYEAVKAGAWYWFRQT